MAGARNSGGSGTQGGAGSTGGRSDSAGGSSSNDIASGSCTLGESRACRYVISGGGNYQESCFVGMQYCDTDTWSGCIDARDAS